jgi:hypothetical protein
LNQFDLLTRRGRPEVVVPNPMVGLDAATGHPIWSGGFARALLDTRQGVLPRVLTGPEDATVCRLALPATDQGTYSPALGSPGVRPDHPRDPRWMRPAPWAFGQSLYFHPLQAIAIAGLALINLVVPLGILRLATRRRFWSVRLLLALPVVAIPLAVFLTIDALEPMPHDSPWLVGTVSTLGGIPFLVTVALLGRSLILGRWKRFVMLSLVILLAAVAIGAIGLGSDMMKKAPIEHYSWAGWPRLVFPAVYAIGMLAVVAWIVRKVVQFVMRLWQRGRLVGQQRAAA